MASRHRKSRTSRIDAAIDAMAPLGFTEEVVVAKMRELLKEYAGQYGFIEADAYSVLLEALLADQEKGNEGQNRQQITYGETSEASETVEGEKVKEGDAMIPAAGFIDIPVCSSTPRTIPLPSPPPPQLQVLVDISPPPPPPQPLPLLPPPPVADAALPPPENGGPRRRKPCHGWISDDDDEEWYFIRLPSSMDQPISLPPTEPGLTGARKSRTKRRSRWDLMPEDM